MNDFQTTSKRALLYRLSLSIPRLIVLLGISAALIVLSQKVAAFAVLIYILVGIYSAFCVLFSVIRDVVERKSYKFKVDDSGVYIESSLIFKKAVFLPKKKIKKIIVGKNKLFFKDLQDLIFKNEAEDVRIKNLTLSQIDSLLKDNYKEFFKNENI